MKRMLFNATQAEELRVAIVEGQTLLDLDIETLGKEQRKGNIYKGVITRIEPSLEACFVDYGTDRHGFLPFKEVSRAYFQDYEGGKARIQDVLQEGMQVIVQVEKDERGNKGAALTTFISLAGRYLVLMPNNPRGGGVSRRIEGEERAELKEAMAQLDVPHGMSIIARTAGIGRSVEELQWDFNYLLQLWRAIEEAAAAHSQPYLLFMESSLVIRAIRDYYRPDIGEILIDNPEVYEQVSEFMSYVMPNNLGKLKLYEDHIPLFTRLQIEQQIQTAFSRSVNLPGGGAIVIDHTEALVSIDVNSARATRGADIEETAFKTNMEAAEEVARQMRLRDLGGLVVIDFIDMEDAKHQREVENTLRDALKKDRARVQMGKLSKFGLLELSRQRLQPALAESSHHTCPRCAGTGVIRSIESTALHVLRLIQDAAMKDNTAEVHVQVPVDVATFLLNEKRAELFGLEERLDVSVFLIPNTHLENPHYELTRIRTDDVAEDAEPSYKRVAVPETENTAPFADKNGEKTVRPEPAVKGIKHTTPAPTAATDSSLWSSFTGWLKKLFGGQTAAKQPEKTEKAGTGSQNGKNRKRNNPNRRKHHAAAEAPATADNTGNNGNANNRKRNRRQDDNGNTETVRAGESAARPNQDKAKAEKDRRRKDRQNGKIQAVRNETATAEIAADKQPENPNAKAPRERRKKEKPLVVNIGNGHTGGKRENGGRQSDRNQERRRNIPSAAKIEHHFSVAQAGQTVEDGIAHVLQQYPDLAEESALVAQRRAAAAPTLLVGITDAEDDHTNVSGSLNTDNAKTATVNTVTATQYQQPETTVTNHSSEHETAVPSEQQIASDSETVAEQSPEATAEANGSAPATIAQPESASADAAATVEPQAAVAEALAPTVPAEETAAAPAIGRHSIAKLAESLNLGGLQFVETKPGALIAAAARLEPKPQPRLRRSDLPAAAPIAPPANMIQVETQSS